MRRNPEGPAFRALALRPRLRQVVPRRPRHRDHGVQRRHLRHHGAAGGAVRRIAARPSAPEVERAAVPPGRGAGRLIDRTRPLAFTFDGSRMTGFAGDTLASALLANGVHARRPQLQISPAARHRRARRRGDERAGRRRRRRAHEPNLRATTVELHDGLVAVSQNRWPSLRFDLGADQRLVLAASARRLLLQDLHVAAALLEAPLRADDPPRRRARQARRPAATPIVTSISTSHCDVLVVGGGAAGLAAAEAAGWRRRPGHPGRDRPASAGVAARSIDGGRSPPSPRSRAGGRRASCADPHHRAWPWSHHNYLLLAERAAPARARASGCGRCAPRQVVLATGAIERPIAFADNDRPGVMLGGRQCATIFDRLGVAPGRRGVVFTNNDDAYRTALALSSAGRRRVPAILDIRRHRRRRAPDEARAAGMPILAGTAVAGSSHRRRPAIEAVRSLLSGRREPARRESRSPAIVSRCPAAGIPAVHLLCHNGGKLVATTPLAYSAPTRAPAARSGRRAAADGAFDRAGQRLCRKRCCRRRPAAARASPLGRGEAASSRRRHARPQAPLEPSGSLPAGGQYKTAHESTSSISRTT